MLRWTEVEDQEIYGLTVKMYREPYYATDTTISLYQHLELDHQSYKYYGTELTMYRILDVNFERYIEERGDLDRINDIVIPVTENITYSVL